MAVNAEISMEISITMGGPYAGKLAAGKLSLAVPGSEHAEARSKDVTQEQMDASYSAINDALASMIPDLEQRINRQLASAQYEARDRIVDRELSRAS